MYERIAAGTVVDDSLGRAKNGPVGAGPKTVASTTRTMTDATTRALARPQRHDAPDALTTSGGECSVCGAPADGLDATLIAPICSDCARRRGLR